MVKKIVLAFIATFLIGLLGFLAIPDDKAPPKPQPHQFFGSVTVGREEAEDGLAIEAEEAPDGNGAMFAMTSTVGGRYGSDSLFLIPADDPATSLPEGFEDGSTIYFFINGIQVAISTFHPGESTELDMELSQDQVPLATPEPSY